ncbi:MAG: DNA mismatch repair endonuclease MutL [Victivallales bacterium]|nr:DNA mismatch repair endonuclease MutL [Victivallales bacterium]
MSVIRVLSEDISNRIAAGEVIERPASVVKELVENAVDAGAGSIVVEIEKAGRKLIAVTDNGSGMDDDDVLMCLEPHATSKIKCADDIDHIVTLGFRGEAVPSIAAVSRFSLTSRMHESLEGFAVSVRGGKILEAQPAGCAPGTRIEVRDLFFNVPARKKFLRADATEEHHIQETMYMLSLPYPGISFELIMDGRRIFSSPAHDSLLPRIRSFFGMDYAKHLLPVDYADADISVKGFIARHGFTRSSRREQRTFFNGRPVEVPAAYRGIRDGFGGILEKGRFAPGILFIRLDPGNIDINVHPAKREVRLKHENQVAGVIAEAVRVALRQAPSPSVTLDSQIPLKALLSGAQVNYQRKPEEPADLFVPAPEIPGSDPVYPDFREERDFQETAGSDEAVETGGGAAVFPEPETAPERVDSGKLAVDDAVQIAGIVADTYILATSADGLMIIDQHAAHERVMFERLLAAAGKGAASQQLLLPVTLELSRAGAALLNRYSAEFVKLGFETESLSSNTVMLNAVPAGMKPENAADLLRDLLTELLEDGRTKSGLNIEALAMASCKAAVKAHDRLTPDEAKALFRQLSECELPFSCPHGRPTIINISLRELERRFGRR